MSEVNRKRVLIAGGSSGIGLAIAKAALAERAEVTTRRETPSDWIRRPRIRRAFAA